MADKDDEAVAGVPSSGLVPEGIRPRQVQCRDLLQIPLGRKARCYPEG